MMGPSSQISKILLTLLILVIIFFIAMDVQLYLRIQHYPIDRNYHFNTSVDPTDVNSINSYEQQTWLSCDYNPLCHVTVKAILLDHTNHYLFAPLATLFDNVVGFSRSFVSANMISFFHVIVACISGKLVASSSLGYRRLGVVLFQFRTFLDDLDGHVARVKKNIRGERSEVGTSGYYIDGICDGLGCIALLLGAFIYLKNNPPRRGYSQLPVTESKLPEPVVRQKPKPTVRKVAKKVISFTGQLLLSSTAWNRYIAVYQDSLERTNVSAVQMARQNTVFKSAWFFCVAWMWRVVNVHSLVHCFLLSIFCDKLWEFLKSIQYIGYVILLIAICITEMHILETNNFIFNSLIVNNQSS
ncbi:ceramide phosphoethanolamine synthase-like [Teleopsis dalmanni]|uniref:ceramide phosphoethanolamine synthase-like n=1 Tax=Teleopsis dalmanni TaxID=139649 RepID=UPI0018CE748B|nr:ceramide phosphoethanolamine synthase-like [Teleopsis dalmanni]XP_037947628.1 ceramide phosphoethanolamine synthase-like [Teleopsis dalmanni]XP_037947629.1 ceramide phosphoethanolamine synthase-like [Teleopsis dalmanni]